MIKLVKSGTDWFDPEEGDEIDEFDLARLLETMPGGAVLILVVPGEDEPDLGSDDED